MFRLVLEVEVFLSKCSDAEIRGSLSKLKILLFSAITAFSGGQHEFLQKMEETEEGEKGGILNGGCLFLIELISSLKFQR